MVKKFLSQPVTYGGLFVVLVLWYWVELAAKVAGTVIFYLLGTVE